MHRDLKRYKPSGIYVLRPSYSGGSGPTNNQSGQFDLPVIARTKAMTEAELDANLAKLKSVVFDAIDANVLLDGVAGVAEAWVASCTDPQETDLGPDDWGVVAIVRILFQRSVT